MNPIPIGIEVFCIACDQYSVIHTRGWPDNGVGQAKAMFAAQLYGYLCHCQVKRDNLEMCFQKIAQFGVIALCANQHFHPCDTTNKHALVTTIFSVEDGYH